VSSWRLLPKHISNRLISRLTTNPQRIVAVTALQSPRAVTERPGDPDFMASLARGLAVIRAFDTETRRLTISQIGIRTGLARAVVRRCLYTLETLGYVLAASDGYSLAPKTLSLGDAYLSSTPLIAHAQPARDEVSARLLESSSLSILDSDQVLYVARAATQRIMSVALHVGSRLPAYCTSMGQVLLAALTPAERVGYFERVPLVAHTRFSITSRSQLERVLDSVQQEGVAIVDQQLEIGLRSIAVPVRGRHGEVVASINASAQASRVSLARMRDEFQPVLHTAAVRISRLLAR
jgi:IclR family pca regulon transcriptional regulator